MGTIEEEELRLFVEYSSPLEPIPATLPESLVPRLALPLPRRPRAVLFDVYGTLFISGSGEVGTVMGRQADASSGASDAFLEAFRRASGASPAAGAGPAMVDAYHAAIRERHTALREQGIPHPEVDIVAVWRRVLDALGEHELEPAPVDLELLAVAYETAANPVWPMPHSRELLARLRDEGIPLGIVSNAQFYTPLLFPALLGVRLAELGVDPSLTALSYRHRRAKPDPELFVRPLAALRGRGIDSNEVAYVGNDMRNDVAAASANGCMTVLFAGDRRSLRVRAEDPSVAGITPDSVVVRLADVTSVCGLQG